MPNYANKRKNVATEIIFSPKDAYNRYLGNYQKRAETNLHALNRRGEKNGNVGTSRPSHSPSPLMHLSKRPKTYNRNSINI